MNYDSTSYEFEEICQQLYTWKLKGNHLKHDSVKNVSFDFYKNIIYFEAFEIVCGEYINLHEWIENIDKETLYFTIYCEFGKPIYEYEIKGLKIVENKSGEFSINKHEINIRKLGISYNELVKKTPKRNCKEKPICTVCLAGDEAEFECDSVEYCDISGDNDHGQVFLKVYKPHDIELNLVKSLVEGLRPTIIINKYKDIEDQVINSNTLKECKLIKIENYIKKGLDSEQVYELTIKYKLKDRSCDAHRHKC